MDNSQAFTPAEFRKLRSFKNPHGIQRFLDGQPYHLADTAWSPRRVLHENTSHCFEGATFAAAALRANGYPALVIDLEAEHDTDHVIAVYKQHGHWGAIAKSNYTGCRYREPVYRTLRELALSYFEVYFNLRRERSLSLRRINRARSCGPFPARAARRPWRRASLRVLTSTPGATSAGLRTTVQPAPMAGTTLATICSSG